MWKIHAHKVTIRQAPSASAPVIAELSDGSTVDIPSRFSGSVIHGDGRNWVEIRLPDGRPGYIDAIIPVEYVGNGMRVCQQCGHTNASDAPCCAQCKLVFWPVRYMFPSMEKPKYDFGSRRLKTEHPVLLVERCSSCLSDQNLEREAVWNSTQPGNNGFTLTMQFLLCRECREIREATTQAKYRFDKVQSSLNVARSAVLAIPLTMALILIVNRRIPLVILVIFVAAWAGSFALFRAAQSRKRNHEPYNDKNLVALVARYGHGYQPLSIDPPANHKPWTLKIHNERYAAMFEQSNPGFLRILMEAEQLPKKS